MKIFFELFLIFINNHNFAKNPFLTMAYQYDVFLSYSRNPISITWIDTIFLPLFTDYLESALGRNAKIFQDTNHIAGNDAWDSRLNHTLAHSKAMVCVWLPRYFNSEWCLRELSAFMYREQTYQLRNDLKPQGLICPIKLFDGEHFPKYVKSYQYLDCVEYNFIGDAFKQTVGYIDLQKKLQEFAYGVAKAVNIAPNWKKEWLNSEFLDGAYNKLIVNPIDTKMTTAPKL